MGFLTALVPLPYRWALLALFAVALMGFGYVKGLHHEEVKFDAYRMANDKAVDAQVAKAAQTTSDLKSDALILEGVKNAEIKTINDRLVTAIGELRSRPPRGAVSAATATACAGVSGAQLASGDAEFLVRYAADSATLASAVKLCEGRYNYAQQQLETLRKAPR